MTIMHNQSNWNEARKTCFPPLPVTVWGVCMRRAPYKSFFIKGKKGKREMKLQANIGENSLPQPREER